MSFVFPWVVSGLSSKLRGIFKFTSFIHLFLWYYSKRRMFYFVFPLDTLFFSEPNRENKFTKRLFTITHAGGWEEIDSEVFFFHLVFLLARPAKPRIYVMKQEYLILMDSKYYAIWINFLITNSLFADTCTFFVLTHHSLRADEVAAVRFQSIKRFLDLWRFPTTTQKDILAVYEAVVPTQNTTQTLKLAWKCLQIQLYYV